MHQLVNAITTHQYHQGSPCRLTAGPVVLGDCLKTSKFTLGIFLYHSRFKRCDLHLIKRNLINIWAVNRLK